MINLKKGDTETRFLESQKRTNLQGKELNISVKGTCIKYIFSRASSWALT